MVKKAKVDLFEEMIAEEKAELLEVIKQKDCQIETMTRRLESSTALTRMIVHETKQATIKPEEAAPVSAKASEAPVFDKAGMMVRMMDDEGLARTVIGGFLDDIPRQIEALKGYLDAGDAPSAVRQAHTIKGASATVGGESLCAAAFDMEIAAQADDLKSVAARLPELENQFARLKDLLNEFISHR
jgi:HPt (histidine-containing phosphotransfer) domain-containing protein